MEFVYLYFVLLITLLFVFCFCFISSFNPMQRLLNQCFFFLPGDFNVKHREHYTGLPVSAIPCDSRLLSSRMTTTNDDDDDVIVALKVETLLESIALQ